MCVSGPEQAPKATSHPSRTTEASAFCGAPALIQPQSRLSPRLAGSFQPLPEASRAPGKPITLRHHPRLRPTPQFPGAA